MLFEACSYFWKLERSSFLVFSSLFGSFLVAVSKQSNPKPKSNPKQSRNPKITANFVVLTQKENRGSLAHLLSANFVFGVSFYI